VEAFARRIFLEKSGKHGATVVTPLTWALFDGHL
jgi:hypothetical protein